MLLYESMGILFGFFFFQAEDGIRDGTVTGVQTCALPISQLGAGAAVGAAAAGGGVVAAGLAGVGMAGSGFAAAGGMAAGAARGGATLAGGATAAYRAGGTSGVATSGLAKGADAVMSPLRRAAGSLKSSFEGGGSRAATGEGSSEERRVGKECRSRW